MPLTALTRVTPRRCARAASQPARKQETIRTVSASGPVHGPGKGRLGGKCPSALRSATGTMPWWRSAAALHGPVSATLHDEHGVAPARIPADLHGRPVVPMAM